MARKKTPESQYHEGDFKKLAAKLREKSHGRDTNALAASIMRKKYGATGWKHIMAKGRAAAAAKK